MGLKKQKPDLAGVMKRRRQTVENYLTGLGVDNDKALQACLAVLRSSYRISDQFVMEAEAHIKSVKKHRASETPTTTSETKPPAAFQPKEEETALPIQPKKPPRKVMKKTRTASSKE